MAGQWKKEAKTCVLCGKTRPDGNVAYCGMACSDKAKLARDARVAYEIEARRRGEIGPVRHSFPLPRVEDPWQYDNERYGQP